MKIFVCYTLRDGQITELVLKKIHKYLSEYGEVFIDLLDNKDHDRQEKVISELMNCNRVVVIETKGTYDSEWVKLELDLSSKLGKIIFRLNIDEFMLAIKENFDIFTSLPNDNHQK